MATMKVNWSFASRIDGGPQLSESQPPIEVTAYDYIKEVLPASTTTDVNLQSGTNPQMVVVLASKYTVELKYKVDQQPPPAAAAPDHVLDGPHIFMGTGAVAFLGSASPKKLTFTNSSTDAITVQVFVGRPA